MPGARPSQASLANVLAAMKAAGIEPGPIRVASDGSFVVEPRDAAPKAVQGEPRRFGAE